MPLTVLSTLARSDLDPWQEAARLTEATGQIATERLAALIASLPGRPSTLLDSGTIAARLVALLPRRTTAHGTLGRALPRSGMLGDVRIIALVVFMVVTLAFQWAVFSHSAPPKTDSPAAATTSLASPPIPPPSAGR